MATGIIAAVPSRVTHTIGVRLYLDYPFRTPMTCQVKHTSADGDIRLSVVTIVLVIIAITFAAITARSETTPRTHGCDVRSERC